MLLCGAVYFAIQIYCDFSGYSDIAIGTAKLFGFDLMMNFSFPYFSQNISEFWQRWHISLSSWFRDYVYIPLGGSRKGLLLRFRNIFIVFVLSGLWHGANWTFVVWGTLHAIYLIIYTIFQREKQIDIDAGESVKGLLNMIVTFVFVVLALIFFRAKDLYHAFYYFHQMFSPSLFEIPNYLPKRLFVLISIFFAIEWFGRNQTYALAGIARNYPRVIRWSLYYAMLISMLMLSGIEQPFIYFQF